MSIHEVHANAPRGRRRDAQNGHEYRNVEAGVENSVVFRPIEAGVAMVYGNAEDGWDEGSPHTAMRWSPSHSQPNHGSGATSDPHETSACFVASMQSVSSLQLWRRVVSIAKWRLSADDTLVHLII